MNASVYEKTYVRVEKAMNCSARYADRVVEILREAGRPMRCAEIGTIMFGEEYNPECYDGHNWEGLMAPINLGHVLRHLHEAKMVKKIRVDDEPIEVEDWGRLPIGNDPEFIKAYDAKGRAYDVPNPDYRISNRSWGYIKKTVTPHHNEWLWVGE